MNIRTDAAGSVKYDHIISKGFKVFTHIGGNDMGQMDWNIPQFTNGKIKITGGYWTWIIKDMDGKKLWDGWWNTNEEFDNTIAEIESNDNNNKS